MLIQNPFPALAAGYGHALATLTAAPVYQAAELATMRLADVRIRLADLKRMEAALSKLVGECNARHGNVSCPLITALHCC